MRDWRQSGLYPSDPIAFFALAQGANRAFNTTSGIVSVASGSGEQELAAIQNPTGSGVDVYLDMGEFGSSHNTTFRRLRGATLSATTTFNSGVNMGGGSRTSSLRMYPGGNYTRTGGTVSKTAHIAAYHQYFTKIGGRVVLRPGQVAAWTIQQQSGSAFTASVYFEYWELPTG